MKRMGLKNRIIFITILAMTLLTAAIMVVGYYLYHNGVYDSYRKYASTACDSTSVIFDKYHIGDLVDRRAMGEDYEKTREEMNSVKDCVDIKYLYAVYFEDIEDLHSICYVINGKNREEREVGLPIEEIYSYMGERCEEDAFDDGTLALFQAALKNDLPGNMFRESTTSEYGHLITCYQVVHNSAGVPTAILGVDVDMNKINQDLLHYLAVIVFLAVLIAVIVTFFFTRFLNLEVIHPITRLSRNTDSFVDLMEQDVTTENLLYEPVEVRRQDEIQELSKNITSMADGIRDYLSNLKAVMAEKERIGAELNVATQIQADMLPRVFPAFPDLQEIDLYATMKPAKEVGGDFYDFFLVDDDHICLVMADVSGKGVPAALFMVIAKTLIKNQAQLGKSPSEILSNVNEQLCEGNEAELFVTVWLAIVEISTGRGVAANAGHEHPVICRKDGQYELAVYRHSPAVATMEGLRFKEHSFELHPGDRLFVYTDGVPEAANAVDELFGTVRMLAALNKNTKASPFELLENVQQSINEFVAGAPQFDDITMLSFVYKGDEG